MDGGGGGGSSSGNQDSSLKKFSDQVKLAGPRSGDLTVRLPASILQAVPAELGEAGPGAGELTVS